MTPAAAGLRAEPARAAAGGDAAGPRRRAVRPRALLPGQGVRPRRRGHRHRGRAGRRCAATVQGSRYEPYVAVVYVAPADDADSLLGLIPDRDELMAECTCPDDAVAAGSASTPWRRCSCSPTRSTIEPEVLDALALRRRRSPTSTRQADAATPPASTCWPTCWRRPRRCRSSPAIPPRLPVAMARRPARRRRRRRAAPTPSACCGHAERSRACSACSGSTRIRCAIRGGDRHRADVGAAGARRGASAEQALAAVGGELAGGVDGDQVHRCLLGGELPGGVDGDDGHESNVRTIVDSSGPRSLACS